jgi:hypothetical protein
MTRLERFFEMALAGVLAFIFLATFALIAFGVH